MKSQKHLILFVLFFPVLILAQNNIGFLHITSDPSGAKVYIDGNYLGETPIEQETVKAGKHKLEVRFENFKSQTMSITIPKNELWSKHIILKEKKGFKVVDPGKDTANQETGKLTIITKPAGATASLDDVEITKRKTPLMLDELGAGEHYVKLTFNNLKSGTPFTVEKTVVVNGSKTTLLNIDIKDYTSKLTVLTQPSGAKVLLDDQSSSTVSTPSTIDYLEPGPHKVKIKKFMGPPLNDVFILDTTITLKAKQTGLLNVNLYKYIGTGYLTIKSNLSGKQVKVSELKYNKEFSIKTPLERKSLYNSKYYQLNWDKEGNRNSLLDFKIYKNRTTKIYIPFFKPLLEHKTLEGHSDYISSSYYLNTNYIPLKEKIATRRLGLDQGFFGMSMKNRHFGSSLAKFWGIFFTGMYLFLNDESSKTLNGILLGVGLYSIGLVLDLEYDYYSKPLPENIRKNKQNRESIILKYEKLKATLEKEVKDENEKIHLDNINVKMYNNKLPKPSVSYK